MVLFTSSCTTMQFLILGDLDLGYAVLFGLMGFFGTLVGQNIIGWAVKRYHRSSLIVLSLGVILGLSVHTLLTTTTTTTRPPLITTTSLNLPPPFNHRTTIAPPSHHGALSHSATGYPHLAHRRRGHRPPRETPPVRWFPSALSLTCAFNIQPFHTVCFLARHVPSHCTRTLC